MTGTPWTTAQLDRIDIADEPDIPPPRSDSTPRNPLTTWLVRAADDLYVRSRRWIRRSSV